jgi:hypothetical protein
MGPRGEAVCRGWIDTGSKKCVENSEVSGKGEAKVRLGSCFVPLPDGPDEL